MSRSISEILNQAEFKDFSTDDFNASTYADTLLATQQDLSTFLSKLSFSIEHLNMQIFDIISVNFEGLLGCVSQLSVYQDDLVNTKSRVSRLNDEFYSLTHDVLQGFKTMDARIRALERVQCASELMRVLVRFMGLVKRLEGQMEGGGGVGVAAASVCECESILANHELAGIRVVDDAIVKIQDARKVIEEAADEVLKRGLTNQNTAELGESLGVYWSLGGLCGRVRKVLDVILEGLGDGARGCFDVGEILKEVSASFGGSSGGVRRVNENVTAANAEIFAGVLWGRLEGFLDSVFRDSSMIYALERALCWKRVVESGITYEETVRGGSEAMGDGIVAYFWRVSSASFEKELKSAVKGSQMMQFVMQTNYPRVLRMFGGLFGNIVVSHGVPVDGVHTVIGRGLTPFESVYLGKSLSRLLEPVNACFKSGGVSRDGVDRILRVVGSELETCKFDKRLVGSVANNVKKALVTFAAKCEGCVSGVGDGFNYGGPLRSGIVSDLEIVNCVWRICEGVWRVVEEYEGEVGVILGKSCDGLVELLQGVVEPIFQQMATECETTLLKIHKESFAKSQIAPRSGSPSGKDRTTVASESSTSPYIFEFSRRRIPWIQQEILGRIQCGEDGKQWVRIFGSRLVQFFLRHASMVCPLSDPGKLKLASDMTQLELALNHLFNSSGMKFDQDLQLSGLYKALRSFKPLLFLDVAQVSSPHHTAFLDPVVVVQHLFVRAYPAIVSPRQVYSWSEIEYSEYLDDHTQKDIVVLFLNCLDVYADDIKKSGGREFTAEYPILRRMLQALT